MKSLVTTARQGNTTADDYVINFIWRMSYVYRLRLCWKKTFWAHAVIVVFTIRLNNNGRRTFLPPAFLHTRTFPPSLQHIRRFFTLKLSRNFLQCWTQFNFCDRCRWVYFKPMKLSRTWHFCGTAINNNYVIHAVNVAVQLLLNSTWRSELVCFNQVYAALKSLPWSIFQKHETTKFDSMPTKQGE